MSKWNKPTPQVSEEFQQNEERRKQMIIEAAKRRKQQEKKQQELQEKERRDSREALSRHKQQKKDAYIKYLRTNIHDKYQNEKREQQAKKEITSNAKWKKKNTQESPPQHLEALDLEVQLPPSNPSVKNKEKQALEKQFQKEWVAQEFQEEWKQHDELLGSQLLDSLDLDFGTVKRDKEVNQLMRNNKRGDPPGWPKQDSKQFKDEVKRLKELIGYESMVMQSPQKIKKREEEENVKRKSKPETNQVQAFNELKRKKEAKIMNWAIEEEQEADDLFSNCSSKKKIVPALKEVNEQLKNKKGPLADKNLPTIDEESLKAAQQVKRVKPKAVSYSSKEVSRSGSKEKLPVKVEPNFAKIKKPQVVPRKPATAQRSTEKTEKEKRSTSQSKQPPKTTENFRSNNIYSRDRSQEKKSSEGRSMAQVQKQSESKGVSQVGRRTTPNMPPLPSRMEVNNNSTATYDLQIDVESFIKQDLMSINEKERQLQEELRDIHINNKATIREVQEKYGIKTDYKRSSELTGEEGSNNSYSAAYRPNEEQIEDSIQNLDHLLIRRDILSKEKGNAIREETMEDHDSCSSSFIRPFSNSEDLCQQVLQLAKNVSRFEQKVEEPVADGYMMKKALRGQSKEKEKSREKENRVVTEELGGESICESEHVERVEPLRGPPVIQPSEKIHVNQKLLRGLLLDDD